MRLGVLDALLQNLLGLLDELPVQIDGVGRDASVGIVLAEDKLRRLSVVFLHFAAVGFALLGELFGARAIAARVCFLGLGSSAHILFDNEIATPEPGPYPVEAIPPLRGFLAREVAQPIVLSLGVTALVVVEGWACQLARSRRDAIHVTPRAQVGHFERHGVIFWLGDRQKVGGAGGACFKWRRTGTRKIESDPDLVP